MKRHARRKNGAKRKLQEVFASDDDENEEFEIDKIVGERVKDGCVQYEVKWTGYDTDDNTWEPVEHLNAATINAWKKKKTASRPKNPLPKHAVCPVCHEPDNLGRNCHTCKAAMHHFCSHDVCKSLNLVQDGVRMEEFDDVCYCSAECYRASTSSSHANTKAPGENPTQPNLPAPPNRPKDIVPDGSKENRAPCPLPMSTTAIQETNLIGKKVAFSPAEEAWMDAKVYRAAGSAYLTGIVSRASKKRKDEYEIRWTNTRYQGSTHVHFVSKERVQAGMEKYSQLAGNAMHGETWEALCRLYPRQKEGVNVDDNFEVLENEYVRYDEFRPRIDTHADVEGISSLEFEPNGVLEAPTDLFSHADGSTDTKIRPECRQQFEQSASSSFLAYLPISFWKQVVDNTNAYAESQKGTQISLEEMMKFLGILFYMSMVDRGEYKNYWGEQVEDSLFGGSSLGLDTFMSLRRFAYIRKNLCFRYNVSAEDLRQDPLARIRPLLNILKVRSKRFVNLGRNVAVDEASVACRSRFGRHLIVFNSSKPTGKYHFKIYTCCCSTSWIAVNFRVHCSSSIRDRIAGVIGLSEVQQLQEELKESSEVRKIVLEVTLPLHGTKRVVNTDNFYTSVQLLESLRVSGLYGRGTIRQNSKHFPKSFKISSSDSLPRGSMRHGVCRHTGIVAASWVDSAIVSVISNADSSATTSVHRRIRQEKMPFPAPICVANYNSAMQGVDRLDQLRSRFSIADGHSFKKWHKKLALAFLDIARCNAFCTRQLTGIDDNVRDPHRAFVAQLASELLNGEWRSAITDTGMIYEQLDTPLAIRTPIKSAPSTPQTPETKIMCVGQKSSQVITGGARTRRGCVICRFEGRHPTEATDHCATHQVCLCKKKYQQVDKIPTHFCPNQAWTCWQKFHLFYFPRGLFNINGRVRRSSGIFLAHKAHIDSTNPPPPSTSEGSLLEQSLVAV